MTGCPRGAVPVGSLDPHTPAFTDDVDALHARLREEAPAAWSDACGGFLLVTRYDDVRRVLLDPVTFSSAHPGRVAVPPTDGDRPPLAPIEVDPPRHDEQVALVARWFTRSAVDAHEPAVRAAAQALVGDRPRLEAVRDLALPLVSTALALVLRLPQSDADRWVAWADRLFAGRTTDPAAAAQARDELVGHVWGLLEERRAQPRDDVLTDLAQGLDEMEALGFGINLLLAGRDATVDGLTTALVHLARHPADAARLRADPALLPRAVEELLRAYTPITHLGRVVAHEVELAGAVLPPGTQVAVSYGAADRDPRAFPQPDEVLLDRRANRHLAFGAGVHRCLGAQVARLVLRAGLAAVLDRPALRLDPARPLVPKPNGDTRGHPAAHLLLS